MKRWVPVAGAAVLLIAIAGGWAWHTLGREAAVIADLAEDVNVEAVMERVELSRGTEGKADWRLTADGADYLRDQGLVRLTNPRITYYRPDGSEVKVSSSDGEVDQDSGDAGLWPDVVIVSGPSTIHSKRLDYRSGRREIELTGDVRMRRKDMVLAAPKLVMQLFSNDIIAEGGVRSMLWPVDAPAKESQQ